MSGLYLIQSAFTIWMMVDCYQRGAASYWYMMLWVPFGPLVYFFAVKIHDFDLSPLKRLAGIGRPASLENMRWQALETPSLANRLALAHALLEAGEAPAEAAALFAEVLRHDGDNKRASYGLARARQLNREPALALAAFDALLAREPGFADGEALRMRADLLWDEGHREEAIADLERLVQQSGRLDFRVALAYRLEDVGRAAPAAALLRQALEEYRHAPHFIQRRDARARQDANYVLKALAARETG